MIAACLDRKAGELPTGRSRARFDKLNGQALEIAVP